MDYSRLAFTYPLSEVRITFDMDLKSGRYQTDMFDPDLITHPIYPAGVMVMEVKCTAGTHVFHWATRSTRSTLSKSLNSAKAWL